MKKIEEEDYVDKIKPGKTYLLKDNEQSNLSRIVRVSSIKEINNKSIHFKGTYVTVEGPLTVKTTGIEDCYVHVPLYKEIYEIGGKRIK